MVYILFHESSAPNVLYDEESDLKHFTIPKVPVIREYFLTFQGHWIGGVQEKVKEGLSYQSNLNPPGYWFITTITYRKSIGADSG